MTNQAMQSDSARTLYGHGLRVDGRLAVSVGSPLLEEAPVAADGILSQRAAVTSRRRAGWRPNGLSVALFVLRWGSVFARSLRVV